MDTGIRRFEAKDIGPALALWRRLLAGMYVNPEPDEEFLRSKTFGNEQFDPEGSFVWDGEGKCAGVVLSFGDRPHENDMWWHTAVAGWIGLLLVAPAVQRRGIGTALLGQAEQYHRQKGRHLILAGGGESINTCMPGVDDSLAGAMAFFKKKGYKPVRSTCFVDIRLQEFGLPAAIASAKESLLREGYSFSRIGPQHREAYKQYLAAEGAGADVVMEQWEKAPRSVIACFNDGEIVGVVRGVRVQDGKAAFSMISTKESLRNKGIGKIILATALEECRKDGGTGMRLWTRPQTAQRFYHKLGFHTEREYIVMGKAVAQDFATEEWIARNRYL